GEASDYVTATFQKPSGAAVTDWIGVILPANFNASKCTKDLNPMDSAPLLCSSPIRQKLSLSWDNFSYLLAILMCCGLCIFCGSGI
ncbi:unnamed protein product, partial [Sphagnum jensenii]